MPFVALRKSTGERINIFLVPDPRLTIDKSDLVCPACGQSLTVVCGLVVTPHFRHIVKCNSEFDRHPESIEHLMGKAYVYQLLHDKFNSDDVEIDFEVHIPEANRQADVLLKFVKTGFIEAHEIQLAGITTESLRDRTKAYRTAGIDVVWWLGKSADTPTNRSWCVSTFGDVRLLSFSNVESNQA